MLGLFALGLARDLVALQDRALGLRARRGRGLLHQRRPGPRRRLARVHHEHRQAGRGDPLQGPRHPGRLLGGGLQLQRRGPEQRPDLHEAQGLRRAAGQEPLARGRAEPGPRADDGDPGGPRDPLRAPGHPGPVGLRRLPVRAARPDGGRHLRPRRRPSARSSERANQSGRVVGLFSSFRANDPQLVVDIDRDKARSLDLPLQEVTDALQVFLGSAVRERLRLQQPGLPRVRPGRPAVPRATRATCASSTRAPRTAPWCRSTAWCARARPRRPRSSATSTCSARRRSTACPRRARARARRSRAMEQLSREALPPGFDFAWAGQSLEEVKAGAQAVYIFALSLVDRVPGAGRPVRELGAALHHPAGRAPGGGRRPRRPAAARPRQRRVLPGGPRHADRPRGQELDPDRGVRGAAARARPGRSRRRRWRPAASACGPSS